MIRRARIDDVAALAALQERALWAAYGGYVDHDRIAAVIPGLALSWRVGLAEAHVRGRETYVLERDGAIAGWVTVGRPRDPDAREGDGELYALYVDPERIGTGDGRVLEEHGVARLRALGYRAATLWVLAPNDRARRFYARRGWEPDDRPGENPYASWAPAIRLRKVLAGYEEE
ncbi:MAG TPA: GNAT family N-acetyltransferase [Capillimicrobium sp.]|nr:GNAT family N-acetyltransferase [Capillimicrobium sp.]